MKEKIPNLVMKNISKSFYGIPVLKNLNFKSHKGEIVAVLGQNGAGKSTLMKILAGIHPLKSYDGEIIVNGNECKFQNTKDAEKKGIVMIPQEVEVIGNLTVAENLYFSKIQFKTIVNHKQIISQAKKDLARFELFDICPNQRMDSLTRAEQQILLIIKALINTESGDDANILILDEPTSSLSDYETEILFKNLKIIKNAGITCLYISHRLEEVFKICDRVFVLRDGIGVYDKDIKESSVNEIITSMVGKEIKITNTIEQVELGPEIFSISGLNTYDKIIKKRRVVKDLSLTLHEGEILGVFGLLGAGKSELALSLFGAWGNIDYKDYKINNSTTKFNTPSDAIKKGIGFLPEDRRKALLHVRNIRENISILSLNKVCNKYGVLNKKKEKQLVNKMKEDLKLKARSLEDYPNSLSGGNKQKVLVSRLLAADSKILIFDEPTIGVDVNTRQEIYSILRELAKKHKLGIIVLSSDIEEIFQVSNQIMVMKNGENVALFKNNYIIENKITQDKILHIATSEKEGQNEEN